MGQALAEGLGARGHRVSVLVDRTEPADGHGALYRSSIEAVEPGSIDAVVDFSSPEGVAASARWCATHRVPLVVGATGLDEAQRDLLAAAAERVGVVVAANFAIGAVLVERFAALAAPYFDRVEVIELHHDRKVDAPSGTAISTARAIASARVAAGRPAMADPTTRETIPHARGAQGPEGVRIHAVRLPGLVAHEEVVFGSPGEGLTLRHDSFDRDSFVAGVAIALEAVDATPRLVEGLGALIR
jgi:4-hydroxy-tetrahydrodipicolinate reductase